MLRKGWDMVIRWDGIVVVQVRLVEEIGLAPPARR
jgi:hypothetical protein